MNINYHKQLDKLIHSFDEKPSLLLHACCAPCASSVLEYLSKHFNITLLWYNPNIYPEAEHIKRLDALKKLLLDMGLRDSVELIVLPYSPGDYYSRIKGLENEPEGASRCRECFRLRLEMTARIAKERCYDYYCSTLTLSRHKNAVLINTLGKDISELWLPSDFKKHDGENRSIELCEKYSVYRQLYCGCEFSYLRRQEPK